MTYGGTGSSGGKCNIMGYWHTGNTVNQQPYESLRKAGAVDCGRKSSDRNKKMTPLTDLGASDALMSDEDFLSYPDLLMLPAVGGAVVPIYNIPELTGNSSLSLILSRKTIAEIFLGNAVNLKPSIISLTKLKLKL